MNILLTCAGRRNYLVHYFQEVLAGRGKVYAADASLSAPALQEADQAFPVPPVYDPEYVDTLVDLCRVHNVALMVPLNDLELPVIAAARERFLDVGSFPLVSPEHVVNICFDKWLTVQFLEQIGVSCPHTYLGFERVRSAIGSGHVCFPVVVKPRWGSASIGIEFPEDEEELELAMRLGYRRLSRSILGRASAQSPMEALLVQERIKGQEYGLDIVNDLQGNYVGTYVKVKLSMRAGETDRAVAIRDPQLEAVGESIGRSLRHIGNMDCDVIVSDDGPYVIELNPRFGGGYPFSHMAGLNLPAAFVAWCEGSPANPNWFSFQPGTQAAKCDRLVVMREEQSQRTRAQQ